MQPGLERTKQLTQLASLPTNVRLSVSSCTRINMVTSVFQESALSPSVYYRCRVLERNNFRKACSDLPRVIE
jgi:hypothetical protein